MWNSTPHCRFHYKRIPYHLTFDCADCPVLPARQKWLPAISLDNYFKYPINATVVHLSDPAMEETFFDTPIHPEFTQLEELARMPDESTIVRFRHRLEEHNLAD